MQVIWKQELKIVEEFQTVLLPENFRFLSCQEQDGKHVFWFQCDPESTKKDFRFQLLETGQNFDPVGKKYLGTVQFDGGEYVQHLYQVISHVSD